MKGDVRVHAYCASQRLHVQTVLRNRFTVTSNESHTHITDNVFGVWEKYFDDDNNKGKKRQEQNDNTTSRWFLFCSSGAAVPGTGHVSVCLVATRCG